MPGTYSHSILEEKSPQYAYVMAILSGGAAFLAAQLGDQTTALLSYALLAAFFASVWPDRAMHWVGWLCLPVILLMCFDMLITGSVQGLWRNGPIFARVLPSACLGAYIGSKLSIRRIAQRLAASHANRSRLKSSENSKALALKALAAPPASSVKAIGPGHDFNRVWPQTGAVDAPDRLDASLIMAAEEGDLDSVRRLVADGADVNAESDDRWTPLMIAALGGDVRMVEMLFGEGATAEPLRGMGWSPLMVATIEGHVEVVRALLERGAKVNDGNDNGWTALRLAVSMDEAEILRLLLDAGADVNSADHEGKTALMQAAAENSVASAKALLQAGADPNLKDSSGQSALTIARKLGHTQIIKLLKEAGADVSDGLYNAANGTDHDNAYFYLLKEELEEALNSYPRSSTPQAIDGVTARLLSELQAMQGQLEAARKERSLAPSEISHKLLLSLREASALSGLPRQHLLEAIEEGALRARLIRHSRRIAREDLDDYISSLS